jgi:hypothetical protein
MIYAADVSSIGIQHEQFNSAFLTLLQKTAPQYKIVFFADPSHMESQKAITDNIVFEEIEIFTKRGGIQEFRRAYHQYKSLSRIVSHLENIGGTQLFVLLVHPLAHFLFKLLNNSKVNTIIVMHGELEALKFNKHFINKIWGWFLKSTLSTQKSHVQYIILGKSIYQNLIKVLPVFKKQKASILDHPYPFDQFKERQIMARGMVTFCSIGVSTIHKYSHKFFEVAKRINESGNGHLCKFNVSGRVYRDMTDHLNEFVQYKKDFGYYTREELDNQLAESTFAVFYYDNTNYSLCASGAFWDAVNAELPLLYVENDYFKYYSKLCGGIGMAFETPEELNNYITKIVATGVDLKHYGVYLNNIKKLKSDQIQQFQTGIALKQLIS